MSPHIEILSPQNVTYTTNSISLNFTINETVSWTAYSLDKKANTTITGNTNLYGLPDGSHNLIVYAKDTAGNTGASRIVYFIINTQKLYFQR